MRDETKNPNAEIINVLIVKHPPSHPLSPINQVQTFGRKKTAVAVVHCKAGKGLIKFNGASRCNIPQQRAVRIKASGKKKS
jgi:hypothetical protein